MFKIFFSFLMIYCSYSYGEIVSIPLAYTGEPATDLVQNGKRLTQLELKKIYRDTQDLSFLNPAQTDIWKNQFISDLPVDDFQLSDDHIYKYVDKVVASIGSFRFVMSEPDGNKRNFNVWVRKDSRSILLRKNLLRSLGYKVPPFQHKQIIKVRFKGMASLNSFINELESNTFADSKRWIIHEDQDEYVLTLQDVIVFQAANEIYDFAEGQVPPETILHRRVINALSIFYSLVDVRESVDGFDWHVGQVDNKVALFDIFLGDSYTTTYFDALWAVKRLAKLQRADFENIVAGAYYPESVASLLVEKLISRRNSLVKLFDKNIKSLSVNPRVSHSSGELVKGRLLKDTWDGHAARYSFEDTESPLARDEMVAYLKSKVYSGVIQNLVSYMNDKLLYSTDIQQEAMKKAIEAQQKQFENFFNTGELVDIPFSTWVVPTIKGNIAASRDIVAGAYLGTDNRIQIADSIEIIGEVGVFVGTLGLTPQQMLFAAGGARYSRSYTHVKSIMSIKAALKEPFRNIMVHNVKIDKSKNIIALIDELASEEFQNADEKGQREQIKEVVDNLDKVMEVGDSLIVANNLVLSGSVSGGYQIPLNDLDVSAMLNFNARKLNISRFHIVRVHENQFQVYKSYASSFGRGMGVDISAYIPILSLSFDKQNGRVSTEFHSLTIKNDQSPEILRRRLNELRDVFVNNSTELLTAAQKPFIVSHNFAEAVKSSQVLVEQSSQVNLFDHITLKHPLDYTTDYYVRRKADLSGTNYMQVTYDILNAIIENSVDSASAGISNTESGNPGDSFYGESFSRSVLVEIPGENTDPETPFEEYIQVKSQWKGWIAGKNKLDEIREIIQAKYGQDIFSDEQFFGTKEVELYSVDLILSIYQFGIDHLTSLGHDFFQKVIRNELTLPWPKGRSHFVYRGGRRFNKYIRDYKFVVNKVIKSHKILSGDYAHLLNAEERSKHLMILTDVLESMLPFPVVEKLLGGSENFYIQGSVNGFRGGVEDGEESIISHSIGVYGSEFPGGITEMLRTAIKISGGELGAYWFLRRIQQ